MVALARAAGATFTEDFSSEPTRWQVWNPGAFEWKVDAQNLAVTWDSRQTNSFFFYKLPMTLTRADAFAVEFALRLDDLQIGIDPSKKSAFEICVGFLNVAEAQRTNNYRGSGVNSATGPRSIGEFSYFPDDGFGATMAMELVSTNNQFAYSHTFPLELTLGDTFRVKMAFDPAAQIMSMQLFRNGEPYGEAPDNIIRPLTYPANFGDFRMDAFSISSYSDAGQNPPQFAGSILAHGIVDDVVITWPDPPIANMRGAFDGATWTVIFEGQGGWTYALERTADFVNWQRVATAAGASGEVQLMDADLPNARGEKAFYRVLAERL